MMKEWKWTAVLLCCYGFLKELRPSEFFLTEYLINHKNFTKEFIVHEAYPISTYTTVSVLPFVFIFTDYLKYRPIILLEAASFIIQHALLIWGDGVFTLRAIRVLHGVDGAAEIAYFTYIYAKVDKARYKKVTSYIHVSILVGQLVASIISQVLISTQLMDFHDLHYITLGGVSAAFILALYLPRTKQSMYFNRRQSIFPETLVIPLQALRDQYNRRRSRSGSVASTVRTQSDRSNRSGSANIKWSIPNAETIKEQEAKATAAIATPETETSSTNGSIKKPKSILKSYEGQIVNICGGVGVGGGDFQNQHIQIVLNDTPKPGRTERLKKAARYLWKHFTEAYTNLYVSKWSIWWAVSTAAHLQVIEYYEALWEEINPEDPEHDTDVYNGAVNAIQFAVSAFFAMGVGVVQIHWFKWGETVLCLISLIQGSALIWMAGTEHIVIAYGAYILYRTLYQVLITVASAEVAEKICEDSHGLVFGFNTFMALCIQTLLTVAVSDKQGLALDIRSEFMVYGFYYVLLGFAFIVVAIYIFCKHGCIQLSWKLPKVELDL